MTSERSQAYGRVMETLAELGPTKLLADEQVRLREAADTLLFSEDATSDAAAAALIDAHSVIDHLVDSERWTEERANRLRDDLEGCGPLTRAGCPG